MIENLNESGPTAAPIEAGRHTPASAGAARQVPPQRVASKPRSDASPATVHSPRVHLVDDDEHFRAGLAILLESAGLDVMCYLSAEHFLTVFRRRPIECVLLDLRMTGMTGLELQQTLDERHIDAPVIVISAFAETASVVQAVQNGALDFLEKPIEEEVLLSKVEAALARDRVQSERRGNLAMRLARLTPRELEVMDLLMAAKTTVAVAHRLNISPKTVEKHRLRIFEKLGVDSVPGLIRAVLG